jgi:hypothetical protein
MPNPTIPIARSEGSDATEQLIRVWIAIPTLIVGLLALAAVSLNAYRWRSYTDSMNGDTRDLAGGLGVLAVGFATALFIVT